MWGGDDGDAHADTELVDEQAWGSPPSLVPNLAGLLAGGWPSRGGVGGDPRYGLGRSSLDRDEANEAGPRPVYVIGRSMFETSALPSDWPLKCNTYVDEVWLPSAFNRDTFAAHGVERQRLEIMPQPIDTGLFNPTRALPLLPLPDAIGTETFVFLSVFKWEERKGWDVLLRAFINEFRAPDDHVALVLRVATDAANKMEMAAWLKRELCSASTDTTPSDSSSSSSGSVAGTEQPTGDGASIGASCADAAAKWGRSPPVVLLDEPLNLDELPALCASRPCRSAYLGTPLGTPRAIIVHELLRLCVHVPPAAVAASNRKLISTAGFVFRFPQVRICGRLCAAYARGGVGTSRDGGDGDGLAGDRDQLVGHDCLHLGPDCVPARVRFTPLHTAPVPTAMSAHPPPSAPPRTGHPTFGSYDLVAAPTGDGHQWAQPSVRALRTLMRRVTTHRDEARAVGERARAHVHAHYSQSAVAEQLIRRLAHLEPTLLRRREEMAQARLKAEARRKRREETWRRRREQRRRRHEEEEPKSKARYADGADRYADGADRYADGVDRYADGAAGVTWSGADRKWAADVLIDDLRPPLYFPLVDAAARRRRRHHTAGGIALPRGMSAVNATPSQCAIGAACCGGRAGGTPAAGDPTVALMVMARGGRALDRTHLAALTLTLHGRGGVGGVLAQVLPERADRAQPVRRCGGGRAWYVPLTMNMTEIARAVVCRVAGGSRPVALSGLDVWMLTAEACAC